MGKYYWTEVKTLDFGEEFTDFSLLIMLVSKGLKLNSKGLEIRPVVLKCFSTKNGYLVMKALKLGT